MSLSQTSMSVKMPPKKFTSLCFLMLMLILEQSFINNGLLHLVANAPLLRGGLLLEINPFFADKEFEDEPS